MKFMVATAQTGSAVYAVNGNTAVNLTALHPDVGPDLMGLIAQPTLQDQLAPQIKTAPAVDIASLTPALPIAAPGAITCLGLNYSDHAAEFGFDLPEHPVFFIRGLKSLMPAGAPMIRPRCSQQLDYEAELMLIVGKGGRYISEADALDHVFGYTLFNDGSVRDYQFRTPQWTAGKNFDSTGAVGPYVVSAGDLPEGAVGLDISCRVGDEVLQSSNTNNMIFSVAQTIAAISEYTTLAPGDLIAMGTPSGVGIASKPTPRWLVPGEIVSVEIEGIGRCDNPVVNEA